ncbi:MAG: His/Gly/Thr/Pro-type tRNA ligase C-terminal domain-containing protein, partial [Spirochaetota bacterium]
GFKFADADLIGIPLRITIGKSYFEKGMAEMKIRNEKDISLVTKESLIDEIKNFYS